MKKILIFLLVMLAVLFAACGKTKEDVIYVGTNAEYKPFEYMENGKLKGFDIDLMNAIGKELDLKIEWVDMKFDGLISALHMDKVDVVIAGLTVTEERAKSVDFSKPYLTSSQIIMVKKGSAYNNIDDLIGKTMGAQLGSVQEQIGKTMDGVTVKTYDTFTGALLELKTDKIEFMMVDEAVAAEYLENNPELKDIAAIEGSAKAIVTKKGNDDLLNKINSGLEKVMDSGKYDEIYSEYF